MKVNYKKEVNGYSDDPDAVISSPTMPSRGHSQASSSLQHSSGGGDAIHMAFTPKIRKWALSNRETEPTQRLSYFGFKAHQNFSHAISYLPFGENATEKTWLVCPSIG